MNARTSFGIASLFLTFLATHGTVNSAAFSAVSSTALGPPTICFPITIADESKTVPLSRDDAALADVPLDRVVLASLDGTTDVLSRMETLRRTFGLARSDAERLAITNALEHRVVLSELEASPKNTADRALAWFTLGYWRQIFAEGSREGFAEDSAYMNKALAIDDTNAAMNFGAAIASFQHRAIFFERIADAFEQNAALGGEKSLLGRNLATVLEHLAPDLTSGGYAEIGPRARAKAAANRTTR